MHIRQLISLPDVSTERGQVKLALEVMRVSLRAVPTALSARMDGENVTEPFVFADWTGTVMSGDLNMLLVVASGRLSENW